MSIPRKLASVVAVCALASGSAVAQETQFIGATLGMASASFSESSRARTVMSDVRFNRIIDNSHQWGLRVGNDRTSARYYLSYGQISDNYRSAAKIRNQTLAASYDLMLPVATGTRLFAGATAGATRLAQITRGYHSDRDWGVHAGLQGGVLYRLAPNLELEAGYRYAWHSRSSVNFTEREASTRSGDARLKSSDELYLGLNWRF